jgi:hypothetical protein
MPSSQVALMAPVTSITSVLVEYALEWHDHVEYNLGFACMSRVTIPVHARFVYKCVSG